MATKKAPKKASTKKASTKKASTKKAAAKKTKANAPAAVASPASGAKSGPSVVHSPVKAFTRTPHHAHLHAMRGNWLGPTKTWFDPTKAPDLSTTTARVELLLGGRFVRLTYASKVMGTPHAGEMTVGHSDDRYEMAWIDSFHTSGAVTPLAGEKGAHGVSCLGSYAAGDERWGWRISLSLTEEGELLVEEWNISPGGLADRAIEMRLVRA